MPIRADQDVNEKSIYKRDMDMDIMEKKRKLYQMENAFDDR